MKIEVTFSETGLALFTHVRPFVVDIELPALSGVIGEFIMSQLSTVEISLVSTTVADGDALVETVTLADTIPFLPGITTLYTSRVPLQKELVAVFNDATGGAGLSISGRGKVLSSSGTVI